MAQKFFKKPFAFEGDKEPIPELAQADGKVSYDKGYTYEYERDLEADPLALPIERNKFNQLQYDVTRTLQDYQVYAYPPYITAEDNCGEVYRYPVGGVCRYDDGAGLKAYVSTTANNANVPSVNGIIQNGWAKVLDTADGLVFQSHAATSAQAGVVRLATEAEAKGGVKNDVAITPYQMATNKANAVVSLAAISDKEPTGSFVTNAYYYNTASKKIFTYAIGAWGNPQTPAAGIIYENDLTLYMWNGSELLPITGSQWPSLSMLIMPCALTGADALGWTPQGGQVTNAVNPQLYQRILAEYNAGADLEDVVVVSNVGGTNETITVPCRRSASSGLKIVDAADRAIVDDLYAQTGSAFYIVLDRTHAVFFLPRFTDGATFTGDIGQVGVYGKDQIVNLTGNARWYLNGGLNYAYASGILSLSSSTTPYAAVTTAAIGYQTIVGIDTNKVVNTGDRAQGRNVKLFVYFRTGCRVVSQDDIDFGGIHEALNLKANSDLSNVSVPHIIETWRSEDGSSWYRKYSDGWIEQSGYISSGTLQTVTFPMPFTTDSYKVFGNVTSGSSAVQTAAYSLYAFNKTHGSATITGYFSTTGLGTATQAFDWYAVGY